MQGPLANQHPFDFPVIAQSPVELVLIGTQLLNW